METKFDSAIAAIAAIDKKKLDEAKQKLQQGKKLLAERQKLIKLADRSECGWATVSAYVTDDLADTPDEGFGGQESEIAVQIDGFQIQLFCPVLSEAISVSAGHLYPRGFQKKTSSRSLLRVWIGRSLGKQLPEHQVLHKIR